MPAAGKTMEKKDALQLDVPAGFEQAVRLTPDEMERHIRLMAALKMFELGKISSGKAADLADLSRVEFLEACGRYQVNVFNVPPEERDEELRQDLDTLREATGS